MKTTLDIDDALLAQAKTLAAQQRSSLTRIIEEGLQLRLSHQQARQIKPPQLPVFAGQGGLANGLDGLNNRALYEAAEHDT